jgi:hypothetical protein
LIIGLIAVDGHVAYYENGANDGMDVGQDRTGQDRADRTDGREEMMVGLRMQ